MGLSLCSQPGDGWCTVVGGPEVNDDKLLNGADNAASALAATNRVTSIRQHGYLPAPVVVSDRLYCSKEAIEIQALDDIPTGRSSWQEIIQ